jgi:hypothetical protein
MSTELQTTLTAEQKALLGMLTPQEQGFTRLLLPRLGMYSQDKFEGKGKSAKLVKEAGMFYTEVETDEKDGEGKKIWEKTEIGTVMEGVILYHRKQLSYYDEATEKYASSPIYDNADDVVPLFMDKKEIHRGTAAELKAKYAYTDPKDGKVKSRLEEMRVIYILKDGQMYLMSLRGSSMWSFSTYAKSCLVSTVLTRFSSVAKENGAIAWNQMSFDATRELTAEEADTVIDCVQKIATSIAEEKEYFQSISSQSTAMKAAAVESETPLVEGKGMSAEEF